VCQLELQVNERGISIVDQSLEEVDPAFPQVLRIRMPNRKLCLQDQFLFPRIEAEEDPA
jgi:hypothetical protein